MERCVPNAGLRMGREVEAEQILKQNFQEKQKEKEKQYTMTMTMTMTTEG